ncbi:putative hydrolase of the HAD superfamily [Kibdelosporangium banguiense]|uniref:Hydrolase of the HAD superfamily n=1 Tax=Kibdelosporangium banguiense TaxID=1365924 RepID=A0ABS4TH76_9PSEU|nr:HAD family hydrolase [Kibdelosporangium banguiense]MBP2323654.1 putative hydrolase of the HAD superfamily [Kibdelosporangium banguiense]
MASALELRSDLLGSVANPPVIAAVCLDIDDTLVDFTSAARSALFALIGRDDMWPAWQHTTDEYVARAVSGELDPRTMRMQRTKAFLTDLGVLLDDETVAMLEDRRQTQMCSGWQLYPDTLACLDWLRAAGLKLAAVTNASGPAQRDKLACLGLTRFFDAVVIAGELGVSKPRPEIFHAACQQLQVPPEQTVHVGDRLDLDAIGAHEAGLHAIWLDRDDLPTSRVPQGVHVIPDLSELPSLLVSEYVTPSLTVPSPRA